MKNLYEIMLEHYAPKDSEIGILTYLVADSDEQVYEWLKTDIKLSDGRWLFTSYKDNEDDGKTFELYDEDYNVIGEESFKDKMIRLKGELYDDDLELSDLYYGKTLIGWKLVKENISDQDISVIKNAGISIEEVS